MKIMKEKSECLEMVNEESLLDCKVELLFGVEIFLFKPQNGTIALLWDLVGQTSKYCDPVLCTCLI